MIPYGRQDIQASDISAVIKVLQSDFLTQGPTVPNFEKVVAKYCCAEHAIAVNSATSALHIALMALGVQKGDVVWTSPNTFVASANAALYCGADVDFVDIDPFTYNISVAALREKLIHAQKLGRLPKVVIPVHLTGRSCEMQEIYELAQQYNFKVVEDASHAIGGKYQGKPVGNCAYSDITVFSFHPVKIVTTAEGGVAVTNQSVLAEKMNLFRSHGITRDPALMTNKSEGPWYYEQITLGYNYRMTDLQAALGINQMQRLDQYVARRHAIANRYLAELKSLPLVLPAPADSIYSSHHLFVVKLELSKICPKTYANVFQEMRKAGILVNLHYIPVHTQPHYQKLGFKKGDFPNAEAYSRSAISLPIFPTLTNQQQGEVVKTLEQILFRR